MSCSAFSAECGVNPNQEQVHETQIYNWKLNLIAFTFTRSILPIYVLFLMIY